jgi:hypothetical protein
VFSDDSFVGNEIAKSESSNATIDRIPKAVPAAYAESVRLVIACNCDWYTAFHRKCLYLTPVSVPSQFERLLASASFQ